MTVERFYNHHDWDYLTDHLLALLSNAPDGLTWEEIAAELALDRPQVSTVIRRLRLALGATDEMNVVIRQDGWVHYYVLVATVDGAAEWTARRQRELLSKTESVHAVWQSVARGTDGRTVDGRVARHRVLNLARASEDIRIELGIDGAV